MHPLTDEEAAILALDAASSALLKIRTCDPTSWPVDRSRKFDETALAAAEEEPAVENVQLFSESRTTLGPEPCGSLVHADGRSPTRRLYAAAAKVWAEVPPSTLTLA
jgi:hypothetical protein